MKDQQINNTQQNYHVVLRFKSSDNKDNNKQTNNSLLNRTVSTEQKVNQPSLLINEVAAYYNNMKNPYNKEANITNSPYNNKQHMLNKIVF